MCVEVPPPHTHTHTKRPGKCTHYILYILLVTSLQSQKLACNEPAPEIVSKTHPCDLGVHVSLLQCSFTVNTATLNYGYRNSYIEFKQ